MSNRERWGRPGRHRVPGATDPVLQSSPRPCQVGGEEGQQVRPLAGPGRHVERALGNRTTASSDARWTETGRQPTACSACCTPPTCISAPVTPTSATPPRAQRERQFAAFKASVDLAISEQVDLFLVAGDLFDSNVQPKRSVERVAARAGPSREGADPLRPRPGHPRRLRPLVGLPRVRHRDPGGQPPPGRADRRPHAGPPVDPPPGARRRRPRARASRRSVPRTARSATSPRSRCRRRPGRSASSTPRSRSRAGRTATRSSSRSRRSPRPGSTTSRSATGTAPRSPRRRASRTPTPVRPRRSPSTRTRPARCSWSRSTTQAGAHTVQVEERHGRPDHVRAPGARRVDDRVAARVHREAQGTGRPGPRPRRPAHRRPARRARPRARGGRGRAQGELPQGPRPGREPAGADRGRDPLRRDDHRRVHPQRRGPDRRPRGVRATRWPCARRRSCATCSASVASCSRATR